MIQLRLGYKSASCQDFFAIAAICSWVQGTANNMIQYAASKISFWENQSRGLDPCSHLFPNKLDVQVNDISLEDYLAVKPKYARFTAHTAGRYQTRRFRKAQCPIVERLNNSLMMHGRNNGKKLMANRIIEHTFDIIHLLSDQNPIQVVIDAIINR